MDIELRISSSDVESLIKSWAEKSFPGFNAERITAPYGTTTIHLEAAPPTSEGEA